MGYFRGMRGTVSRWRASWKSCGSAARASCSSAASWPPRPAADRRCCGSQTYPLLAVEISTGTSDLLIGRLNEGRLDVVIGRMLTLPPRDYVFRPIGDEALSVIAAVDHPLAGRARVSFEALREYPWILQPQGARCAT